MVLRHFDEKSDNLSEICIKQIKILHFIPFRIVELLNCQIVGCTLNRAIAI